MPIPIVSGHLVALLEGLLGFVPHWGQMYSRLWLVWLQ